MIDIILKNILRFIFLVLLQVLVLNNIQISGYINPYLYVLFIILLPIEIAPWLLLITGFFTGFTIDLFTNTMGIHASATVFMTFFRPLILRVLSPRDGYEPGLKPIIANYGISWFVKYTLTLIFIHHTFLFIIEIFRFSDFHLTLTRILLSSIFTFILVMISQLFVRK
ncbi:MAG: rod shape-determining protein MreD [Marinilabiliales bacterium]